jgi:hypothetical protein
MLHPLSPSTSSATWFQKTMADRADLLGAL